MHPLPIVPKEEILKRINRFQSYLQETGIGGAIITQNVDIFYLTGTMQSGILYIPDYGEPCFYVKKSVKRAQFETAIPVEPLGRTKELEAKILARFKGEKIGIEMDVIPYGLAIRYMRMFPHALPVDISTPLRMQRAIKSQYELDQIAEAAKMVYEVMAVLPEMIRPGVSELELAAKIEYKLRLMGNYGITRMRGYNQEIILGMVASGSAAAVPTYFDGPAGGTGLSVANPQGASRKMFKIGEPILLDISAVHEGYLIDQTRLAVIGELEEDLEEAYQAARYILSEIEKIAKPGVGWQDLYLNACEMARLAGLEKHFMGYGSDQARFLGHGVGLEMDELPILAKGFNQPLEKGMVIAIEPKFTFPGRGVVGLENTYLMTEKGLQSITFAPEEIIQIDVDL